jgi:hypothetical protein
MVLGGEAFVVPPLSLGSRVNAAARTVDLTFSSDAADEPGVSYETIRRARLGDTNVSRSKVR